MYSTLTNNNCFYRRGGFNVKSYDDLIFSDITASAIGYTPITKVSKIKPVKIDMFQNHVHELLRDDGIELFKEYTMTLTE